MTLLKGINPKKFLRVWKKKKSLQLKKSFSIQNYLSPRGNFINYGYGKIQGLKLQLRRTSGSVNRSVVYLGKNTKYKIISLNENEQFSANHEKSHEIKTVLLRKILNTNISV